MVREALIDENVKISQELADEKAKRVMAQDEISQLTKTVETHRALIDQLAKENEAREYRRRVRNERLGFFFAWVVVPIILTLFVGLAVSPLVRRISVERSWQLAVAWWILGLLFCLWLVDKRGQSNEAVAQSGIFNVFHRSVKHIVIALEIVVYTVTGSAIWEFVKALSAR